MLHSSQDHLIKLKSLCHCLLKTFQWLRTGTQILNKSCKILVSSFGISFYQLPWLPCLLRTPAPVSAPLILSCFLEPANSFLPPGSCPARLPSPYFASSCSFFIYLLNVFSSRRLRPHVRVLCYKLHYPIFVGCTLYIDIFNLECVSSVSVFSDMCVPVG